MTEHIVGRELYGRTAVLAPIPPFQDRGSRMADDWPLQSYLKLGALPGAVPCARLHARQIIWEWGHGDFSETVELLVSELVTNAIKASQAIGREIPIRFWLLSDKVRLQVLVWDGHPGLPVRRDVGHEDESGRGLLLVEALAEAWSWYPHPTLGGKVVWCEIAVNDSSEQQRYMGWLA